mgnify:CR=1 FL=1
MKKIYQIPTTTVMNIEPQAMMQGSEYIKAGGSYNGNSAIESRQGGSWDDDED